MREIEVTRRREVVEKRQTERTPKTNYWILHCTSERRDPAPPTRTQM